MHQHATGKELGLVPIPVTSPFLPLSPQIASAWRMMWQYWCQHHSPGAWELRTVMYSWVPSESSIALYNREPRSTYRVAVARPLCQLIHYSCRSFSDSVWTTPSITNAPIGDETFSLDLWIAPLSKVGLLVSYFGYEAQLHRLLSCWIDSDLTSKETLDSSI